MLQKIGDSLKGKKTLAYVVLIPLVLVFAVWGAAANNVWITGELGFMLRWNGTDLSEFPSGGTALYTRLRGASANKMWLVTESGSTSAWDGMRWGATSRSLSNGSSLTNLWVANETTIWSTNSSSGIGLAWRWNGTTSTPYSYGYGNAIWTVGTTDGWVVGDYARIVRLNNGTGAFDDRW